MPNVNCPQQSDSITAFDSSKLEEELIKQIDNFENKISKKSFKNILLSFTDITLKYLPKRAENRGCLLKKIPVLVDALPDTANKLIFLSQNMTRVITSSATENGSLSFYAKVLVTMVYSLNKLIYCTRSTTYSSYSVLDHLSLIGR